MLNQFVLKDLADVIRPLPQNKKERQTANRNALKMSANKGK